MPQTANKMPTSGAPCPWVAVVGSDGVGTHALVARLIDEDAPAETSAPIRWTLDTKYFSADVDVRVSTPADTVLDPAPEAVVLTFDRSTEGTFDEVRAWWERTKDELEGAEVRLCVANNVSSGGERWSAAEVDGESSNWSEPGVMSRCWEWCVDEGFEPVEVCTGDAQTDAQLARLTLEPQGIVRVREALHSHMWPGLVRKDALLSTSAAASSSTPPPPAATNGHADAATPPAAYEGNGTLVEGPAEAAEEQLNHTEQIEREDVALERIMTQMMQARSAAQNNELSDEDRRARAADLALQLAAMMGHGDDSSSEDEA